MKQPTCMIQLTRALGLPGGKQSKQAACSGSMKVPK